MVKSETCRDAKTGVLKFETETSMISKNPSPRLSAEKKPSLRPKLCNTPSPRDSSTTFMRSWLLETGSHLGLHNQ